MESTGSVANNFLGSASIKQFCLFEQEQPSRYNPYTYTPSDGVSRMDSTSCNTSRIRNDEDDLVDFDCTCDAQRRPLQDGKLLKTVRRRLEPTGQ